jgi:hypothetical protein
MTDSPYGQLIGTFDFHTNKEKMEEKMDKFKEIYLHDTIFETLSGIAFLLAILTIIGGIILLFNSKPGRFWTNLIGNIIVLVFLIALIILLSICHWIAKHMINLQFRTYKQRQLEYAPPTRFVLRVWVYEKGVYFAATEKFDGYMPYTGNFRYMETDEDVIMGSIEMKIFLGINKKWINSDAKKILAFAEKHDLVNRKNQKNTIDDDL